MEVTGIKVGVDATLAKQGEQEFNASLDSMVAKSRTVSQQISAGLKGGEGGFRDFANATRTLSTQVVDNLQKIGEGFKGVIDSVLNFRTVMEGALFGLGIGEIINEMSQVENIKQGLSTMSGSAAVAAQQWKALGEIASEVGLTSDEVARKMANLQMATHGTALEGERTATMFMSAARAAQAMGGGTEQAERILQSFTNILSQQNVQGTMMIRQLSRTAGIPDAMAIAARSFGMSVDQMIAKLHLMGAAGIGSEEFVTRFSEQLLKEMMPAAERAANSIDAWKNRVKNAFADLMLDVGEGGFGDSIRKMLMNLTDTLQSPEFQQAARQFGTLLTQAINLMTRAVEFAGEHITGLKVAFAGLLAVELINYFAGIARSVMILGEAFAFTTVKAEALAVAETGLAVGSVAKVAGTAAATLLAGGGVMTAQGQRALPVHRYAAGGVATSAQHAIFGEGSTPEAYVPLADGRTIPVTLKINMMRQQDAPSQFPSFPFPEFGEAYVPLPSGGQVPVSLNFKQPFQMRYFQHGGVTDRPAIFGESGQEAAIPMVGGRIPVSLTLSGLENRANDTRLENRLRNLEESVALQERNSKVQPASHSSPGFVAQRSTEALPSMHEMQSGSSAIGKALSSPLASVAPIALPLLSDVAIGGAAFGAGSRRSSAAEENTRYMRQLGPRIAFRGAGDWEKEIPSFDPRPMQFRGALDFEGSAAAPMKLDTGAIPRAQEQPSASATRAFYQLQQAEDDSIGTRFRRNFPTTPIESPGWLAPTGRFHPIGRDVGIDYTGKHEGHYGALEKLGLSSYDEAWRKGYVRVKMPSSGAIEFDTTKSMSEVKPLLMNMAQRAPQEAWITGQTGAGESAARQEYFGAKRGFEEMTEKHEADLWMDFLREKREEGQTRYRRNLGGDPQQSIFARLGREMRRAHLQTGGSTFDPRTGENMIGRPLWSVGIAPELERVTPHAPSAAMLQRFAREHADVLTKYPQTAVGTYYDEENKRHITDLVALTKRRQSAMEAGRTIGEQSIFNLQTFENPPTGVGQMSPGGIQQRPPITTTLEQRLQQLAQEDARTSETTRFRRAFGEGTGAGSEALGLFGPLAQEDPDKQEMLNVARQLQQVTLSKARLTPLSAASSESRIFERAMRFARPEFEHQLQQPKSGIDWYKDTALMKSAWAQLHPEMAADKELGGFATSIVAASSLGQQSRNAVQTADQIYSAFKESNTGRIPLERPGGDFGIGPWSVRAKPVLSNINQILDKTGSPQAAYQWMMAQHPVEEVAGAVGREALAGIPAGTQTFGSMALSPTTMAHKAGNFFQNLEQNPNAFTMDMWQSRQLHRWMGNLITPKGELADVPRGNEPDILRKVFAKLGGEKGLSVGQAQGAMWNFEQNLWQRAGAPIRSQPTYGDAMQQYVRERNERDLGFNFPDESTRYMRKFEGDPVQSMDDLIKRYGTTGDVTKAGFIAPTGKMVPIVGEHEDMLRGASREDFIKRTGAVRSRYSMGRAGERMAFSIPPTGGVTERQAAQIRAAAGKMRYGEIAIEQAMQGGKYEMMQMPTGRGVNEALERLGGIRPEEEEESATRYMRRLGPAEPLARPQGTFDPANLERIREQGAPSRRSNAQYVQDVIRRTGLPSVDPEFERNMRLRSEQAMADRLRLGSVPLTAARPTYTAPPPPEMHPVPYYERYGRVKRLPEEEEEGATRYMRRLGGRELEAQGQMGMFDRGAVMKARLVELTETQGGTREAALGQVLAASQTPWDQRLARLQKELTPSVPLAPAALTSGGRIAPPAGFLGGLSTPGPYTRDVLARRAQAATAVPSALTPLAEVTGSPLERSFQQTLARHLKINEETMRSIWQQASPYIASPLTKLGAGVEHIAYDIGAANVPGQDTEERVLKLGFGGYKAPPNVESILQNTLGFNVQGAPGQGWPGMPPQYLQYARPGAQFMHGMVQPKAEEVFQSGISEPGRFAAMARRMQFAIQQPAPVGLGRRVNWDDNFGNVGVVGGQEKIIDFSERRELPTIFDKKREVGWHNRVAQSQEMEDFEALRAGQTDWSGPQKRYMRMFGHEFGGAASRDIGIGPAENTTDILMRKFSQAAERGGEQSLPGSVTLGIQAMANAGMTPAAAAKLPLRELQLGTMGEGYLGGYTKSKALLELSGEGLRPQQYGTVVHELTHAMSEQLANEVKGPMTREWEVSIHKAFSLLDQSIVQEIERLPMRQRGLALTQVVSKMKGQFQQNFLQQSGMVSPLGFENPEEMLAEATRAKVEAQAARSGMLGPLSGMYAERALAEEQRVGPATSATVANLLAGGGGVAASTTSPAMRGMRNLGQGATATTATVEQAAEPTFDPINMLFQKQRPFEYVQAERVVRSTPAEISRLRNLERMAAQGITGINLPGTGGAGPTGVLPRETGNISDVVERVGANLAQGRTQQVTARAMSLFGGSAVQATKAEVEQAINASRDLIGVGEHIRNVFKTQWAGLLSDLSANKTSWVSGWKSMTEGVLTHWNGFWSTLSNAAKAGWAFLQQGPAAIGRSLSVGVANLLGANKETLAARAAQAAVKGGTVAEEAGATAAAATTAAAGGVVASGGGGGILAAVKGIVTAHPILLAAAAAVAAIGVALYAARDNQVMINGEAYKMSDIYTGVWMKIKAGASFLWDGIKSIAKTTFGEITLIASTAIDFWFGENATKKAETFFSNTWEAAKTYFFKTAAEQAKHDRLAEEAAKRQHESLMTRGFTGPINVLSEQDVSSYSMYPKTQQRLRELNTFLEPYAQASGGDLEKLAKGTTGMGSVRDVTLEKIKLANEEQRMLRASPGQSQGDFNKGGDYPWKAMMEALQARAALAPLLAASPLISQEEVARVQAIEQSFTVVAALRKQGAGETTVKEAIQAESTIRQAAERMRQNTEERKRQMEIAAAPSLRETPVAFEFQPPPEEAVNQWIDALSKLRLGSAEFNKKLLEMPQGTSQALNVTAMGFHNAQEAINAGTQAFERYKFVLGQVERISQSQQGLSSGEIMRRAEESTRALFDKPKEIDYALVVKADVEKNQQAIRDAERMTEAQLMGIEAVRHAQAVQAAETMARDKGMLDSQGKIRQVFEAQYQSIVRVTEAQLKSNEVLKMVEELNKPLTTMRDRLEQLREAWNTGRVSTTLYKQAVDDAGDAASKMLDDVLMKTKSFEGGAAAAFRSYSRSAMDAAANARRTFDDFMTGMEDKMTAVLTGEKGVKFADVFKTLQKDMTRAFVREQITGPMAGVLGDVFGSKALKDYGKAPPKGTLDDPLFIRFATEEEKRKQGQTAESEAKGTIFGRGFDFILSKIGGLFGHKAGPGVPDVSGLPASTTGVPMPPWAQEVLGPMFGPPMAGGATANSPVGTQSNPFYVVPISSAGAAPTPAGAVGQAAQGVLGALTGGTPTDTSATGGELANTVMGTLKRGKLQLPLQTQNVAGVIGTQNDVPLISSTVDQNAFPLSAILGTAAPPNGTAGAGGGIREGLAAGKGGWLGKLLSGIGMKGDSSGMLQGLGKMLGIGGQKAGGFFGNLFGNIGSGIGSAASGIGGFFSNIFSGIAGFLAGGGNAMAGKSYVVGERGPEIFSPSVSGTVMPMHAFANGGTTAATGTLGTHLPLMGHAPLPGHAGREPNIGYTLGGQPIGPSGIVEFSGLVPTKEGGFAIPRSALIDPNRGGSRGHSKSAWELTWGPMLLQMAMAAGMSMLGGLKGLKFGGGDNSAMFDSVDKSMGGLDFGGGGDGASSVGDGLGFAKGGVFTPRWGHVPIRQYDLGGITMPNRPQAAIFGEGSMPEAYVPLPDGRTIPVTMGNRGGMQPSQVVQQKTEAHVHIHGVTDMDSFRKSKAQIAHEASKLVRRG
jgi:tape measure domain-containing protein